MELDFYRIFSVVLIALIGISGLIIFYLRYTNSKISDIYAKTILFIVGVFLFLFGAKYIFDNAFQDIGLVDKNAIEDTIFGGILCILGLSVSISLLFSSSEKKRHKSITRKHQVGMHCKWCRTPSLIYFDKYYECSKCERRYILYHGTLKPYGYSPVFVRLLIAALAVVVISVFGSFITYSDPDRLFMKILIASIIIFLIVLLIYMLISGVIIGRYGLFIYREKSPFGYWFSLSLYCLFLVYIFYRTNIINLL